ncbi:NAD(P)H steroid dehydrogenase-like protein in alkane synthesis cluster [hydrothermal vent metagenome]|uniref:NAD(P)H steroid dehydrogenase-like protein in alkane synthesis cluster n=1 Tax=hydrothermal vent metagenome TaxID=652676 RepID=A0A3B0SRS4_9ZZZZ
MKVFVTGATSLIGRSVVARLIERGDDVAVFQRRPSGLDVEEHLGDITDRDGLARAMADAEAVVHVAARVAVTGPWDQFERINVGGTRNAIEAARGAGVRRFVQVSSPSVTHTGRSLVGAPADPADPDHARGHYARSKALAELVALGASSETMPVVAIRPHLIWGPGDTQLVGRIVDRARKGRLAIVGSGTALIDSIYIDNAADALVAAVDRAPRLGGRALVVTNGQPRPVRELVNRIVVAAGLTPPRRKVPFQVARTGGLIAERIWALRGADSEPPMTSFLAEQLATAHWFDQRKAREALDWEPKVSLDEGFDRLAAWFAEESPHN